ncbi:MAG TPA: hypothetical protein VMU75_01415 [Acidimicrobiales bacterium]|nr:hypothetical protein [Acidimicrobiales bacterium]
MATVTGPKLEFPQHPPRPCTGGGRTSTDPTIPTLDPATGRSGRSIGRS